MKIGFKSISTILIIILVAILVAILVNYYNTPIRTISPISELNTSDNREDTNHNVPIISENISGDFVHNNNLENNQEQNQETIIKDSGEINQNIDEKDKTPEKNNDNTPVKKDITSSVIITSEDTMTNKEKREILTELDNTLMELLDVVNKVETVDESRLIIDESEVQK